MKKEKPMTAKETRVQGAFLLIIGCAAIVSAVFNFYLGLEMKDAHGIMCVAAGMWIFAGCTVTNVALDHFAQANKLERKIRRKAKKLKAENEQKMDA